MESFNKDQCCFQAVFTKQCIYSDTYSLQDWCTTGMDARQTIHLRNCLPSRIRLLRSPKNNKTTITSAGIVRGGHCFFAAIQNGGAGIWRKGTAPFLPSAKLDLNLWVNMSPENQQIKLFFLPIPVYQHDDGIDFIRQ